MNYITLFVLLQDKFFVLKLQKKNYYHSFYLMFFQLNGLGFHGGLMFLLMVRAIHELPLR